MNTITYTAIKDCQPTKIGWYVCRFYNGMYGYFYVRGLMTEDKQKMSCISDIHVMERGTEYDYRAYRETMNRDDIVAWCYISD